MVKINLLKNILKSEKKKYNPKGFWDHIFYCFDREFYEPEVKKKKKPPIIDKIWGPGFNFICKCIIQPIFRYDVYKYIKKQEMMEEKQKRIENEEKIFPPSLGISK